MSKNTSISLGPYFVDFIEKQVASGRYATTSEVVREALKLLETRETKLAALREAVLAGERSGPSVPFDFNAFLAEMHAQT